MNISKSSNYPKLLPFNDAEIVRSKNLERDEVQVEIASFLEENESLIDMDKRTYMTRLKESLSGVVKVDLAPTKILKGNYYVPKLKPKIDEPEVKEEEKIKDKKKDNKDNKEKKKRKEKESKKEKKDNASQENGKKRKRTDPENSVDSVTEKPKKKKSKAIEVK